MTTTSIDPASLHAYAGHLRAEARRIRHLAAVTDPAARHAAHAAADEGDALASWLDAVAHRAEAADRAAGPLGAGPIYDRVRQIAGTAAHVDGDRLAPCAARLARSTRSTDPARRAVARRTIEDLAATAEGRNVLRALLAAAGPTTFSVDATTRIVSHVLVDHDAAGDAAATPGAVVLAALAADGDAPALAALAARPRLVRRIVDPAHPAAAKAALTRLLDHGGHGSEADRAIAGIVVAAVGHAGGGNPALARRRLTSALLAWLAARPIGTVGAHLAGAAARTLAAGPELLEDRTAHRAGLHEVTAALVPVMAHAAAARTLLDAVGRRREALARLALAMAPGPGAPIDTALTAQGRVQAVLAAASSAVDQAAVQRQRDREAAIPVALGLVAAVGAAATGDAGPKEMKDAWEHGHAIGEQGVRRFGRGDGPPTGEEARAAARAGDAETALRLHLWRAVLRDPRLAARCTSRPSWAHPGARTDTSPDALDRLDAWVARQPADIRATVERLATGFAAGQAAIPADALDPARRGR